jgi:hypothetical protein
MPDLLALCELLTYADARPELTHSELTFGVFVERSAAMVFSALCFRVADRVRMVRVFVMSSAVCLTIADRHPGPGYSHP